MMAKSLPQLEHLLNYSFKDIELLERALTHRSWANEKLTGDIKRCQNERLEFVGDSVLGLAVAEYLYQRNPDLSEGDLTLMKHHLVSSETLGKIAKNINLGSFMRIGRGEEKTGGRRKPAILADTLEAVIAAIFFDSGYISARKFVTDMLSEEIRKVTPTSSLDFKTLLQETLQGQKRATPTYEVVKTDGPPHDRLFTVEAMWDTGKTQGEGNTIKSAEMEAADRALGILKSEVKKQDKRV